MSECVHCGGVCVVANSVQSTEGPTFCQHPLWLRHAVGRERDAAHQVIETKSICLAV